MLSSFPRFTAALASLLTLAASGAVQAQEAAHVLMQHPAVSQQTQLRGIDPNTFIVAHPAGLSLKAGHANQEHPAVMLARQLKAGVPTALDANTFIVQPPASTRWTSAPAQDSAVARL